MQFNAKYKLGAALGGLYIVYMGYLFFTTTSIDTVILQPENCTKLKSLPTIRYSDNQFFAMLKQKRKVVTLGGDTLYLPPSLNKSNFNEGKLSGIAYKCNSN